MSDSDNSRQAIGNFSQPIDKQSQESQELRKGLIEDALKRIKKNLDRQSLVRPMLKISKWNASLLFSSTNKIDEAISNLTFLNENTHISNKMFLSLHEQILDLVGLAQEDLAIALAWRGAIKGSAREKAIIRHSKIGGSREKRQIIQEIWKTGKYDSRDICAEQECATLGMSFSTARKALRGVPTSLDAPSLRGRCKK
jgi:hypothetical protein